MDSNKFELNQQEDRIDSKSDMEADGTKVKRKRRSKNEQEGRSFSCSQCGKSYLSQPALTNHNKTKHHQNDPDYIKRGRGRPRKNPVFPNHPEKDIQKFKHFFNKENRRRQENELLDFEDVSRSVFLDLSANYSGKFFNKYSLPEEHPFLVEIVNQFHLSSPEVYTKTTCDQIFASYINEFFKQTNKNYYMFLTKFVILFRECINIFRQNTDANSTLEFTQNNSSDTVPDLCNEFITDFMENNDNFGLDTTELIEIIQHFCNWLYENKYTTSRLTLLS